MGGHRGTGGPNGSHPRVVSLSVATATAPGHEIDDALDGLVTTVDDLARDLAFEDFEPPRRSSALRVAAPRPHGRAYLVAVMVALIAFELLVLDWILHP
jgi:hypothetical protein